MLAGCILTTLFYSNNSISITEMENIKKTYTENYNSTVKEYESNLLDQKQRYENKIDILAKESATRELELSRKIDTLSVENKSLKKNTKKVVIETIHPDGTVERVITSTSEIQSESNIISRIKEQSDKKLKDTVLSLKEEHQKEISEKTLQHSSEIKKLADEVKSSKADLEEIRKKTKDIINKPFSAALGINTDLQYTFDASYVFIGPFFVGGSYDKSGLNNKNTFGVSLGMKF
jgi:ATP-dependent Lon protease